MSKPHAHPSFTLIGGCKWYMVLHGEVVTLRPIELAPARGERECVHCGRLAGAYCRSCRRPVCSLECPVCDQPLCPSCLLCVSGQCPRTACICQAPFPPDLTQCWTEHQADHAEWRTRTGLTWTQVTR